MKKVVIFFGSCRAFAEITPKNARSLTSVAIEMDEESKKLVMVHKGLPQSPDTKKEKRKLKPRIINFVISADEYCGVQEHVILNFGNFISKLSITNLYIQNPPVSILDQLYRNYGSLIEEVQQPYPSLDEEKIRHFNKEYSKVIIGQNKVKQKLLQALYPSLNPINKKPIVILLYGDTGLGKTETAQFLTDIVGGILFRKQFSMYQNNEFANYLFGGRYNEKSFTQDLLARDSNVILLDEFDKANPVFHSAFYQLFDEGEFSDQNYRVSLEHTIIICTSNYITAEEIKSKLGAPIYNRFDAVIEFAQLSENAKRIIAADFIKKAELDYGFTLETAVKKRLEIAITSLDNAREIQRAVKDTFSLIAVRKICGSLESI